MSYIWMLWLCYRQMDLLYGIGKTVSPAPVRKCLLFESWDFVIGRSLPEFNICKSDAIFLLYLADIFLPFLKIPIFPNYVSKIIRAIFIKKYSPNICWIFKRYFLCIFEKSNICQIFLKNYYSNVFQKILHKYWIDIWIIPFLSS